VGLLFNIAFRVLKNHEAAEDVVQEVFVQIWEKAPLYDPSRGKPSTWAVVLTRNRAIDRVRSERRGDRLREKVESEAAVGEQFDDRSSFDAVTALEAGSQMRQAIQKLSVEQREVIDLAFFHSLTHVEIAERLGIPLGTVKARVRRGMLKLRDLLGPRE
jgi:RNA polymerase sigma-70 factor (ECF subfamily)